MLVTLTFDGDGVVDGCLVGHRDLDSCVLGGAFLPDVDVVLVHAPVNILVGMFRVRHFAKFETNQFELGQAM